MTVRDSCGQGKQALPCSMVNLHMILELTILLKGSFNMTSFKYTLQVYSLSFFHLFHYTSFHTFMKLNLNNKPMVVLQA